MFIILYGIGLAFFWFRAARLNPEDYPQLPEAVFIEWKSRRLRSCRKYAALFILQILLAFIIGIIGHSVTRAGDSFFESPGYFQALVFFQMGYTAFILLYTAHSAWRNYQYGRAIGAL